MIFEGYSQYTDTPSQPDCVIIGAGAVGIHLAVQLAKRGRHVLLFESGNRILGSYDPKSYRSIGRKHEGVKLGRSVALGGTTNLWGGQLVKFDPLDVQGRDWIPNSAWPINYEELEKFYPETYRELGVAEEFQDDHAIWNSLGKTNPDLGPEMVLFLTRWMKVPNLAKHYTKELETNPNIAVVLNTTAVGFENDNKRITAATIIDSQQDRHKIEGKHFVLCAGTIENTRLLLHAASDPSWECPWKANDNLGRYFHDHLGGRLAYVKPKDTKKFDSQFSTIVLRGNKFQPKVRLREPVVLENSLLSIQAMVAFEHSIKENLVFLKQFLKAALFSRRIGSLREFFRNMIACWKQMIPLMWKYVVEHRILIPSGSRISLIVQSEVLPQRESRISINPEKRDANGLPEVLVDWKLSGIEIEHMHDFIRRVEKSFQENGLADLEIEPLLAEKSPEFLETLHDTYHHSGGCVMGDSEAEGVVDRNLTVFGTENLSVLGACTYRTCSHANSTFTALTLGTRLAQHISQKSNATSTPQVP